jgi:hypothetical protein
MRDVSTVEEMLFNRLRRKETERKGSSIDSRRSPSS